jgi:peroxiredoxin Q/BCP
MAIQQGHSAPDFCLHGSDGKQHRLADYAGSKLIIYFYPKDNTPGCTKESCAFAEMHDQLLQMNVKLLGVSKDSLDSHDKFISQFHLPFTLLSDPDTTMMQDYQAWGEKTMYGKTSIGCIRSMVLIDEQGTVIKHWPKVANAAEYPQQVLDFILKL